MRQQVPVDIVGSSSFERYKKQSRSSTINMIISDNALVPFAGYKKQVQIIDGPVESREIYRSVKYAHLIVVFGAAVYEVDDNLAYSFIGNLETSSGDVFIAENNNGQIAIVDGLFIYIYNYSTTKTLDRITVDFAPVYIDFQDTYFIAADGNSNEWRLSRSGQGTQWPNASDSDFAQFVGTLETKPDLMVAAVRFNRQMFIMGTKTTEIWHDVGARIFPYQRDNNISIDYGCLSAATIASGFGYLVWLAANEKAGPTIRVSTGGEPRELSTDGINFALDKLTTPEDSTAFLFEEDGHVFYQITFRTDNQTFVYDFNTQKFFNVTDECLNAHIAKRIAFFNNTHYFVAKDQGALYELSTDYTSFINSVDGSDVAIIPRIRLTKNFRLPDASKFKMTNLSITLEQGQSHDTQYMYISLSKDGAETFGTANQIQMRKIPGRENRLRQFNMGVANDAVFQFRMEGAGRFVIIGATMEVIK